MDGEVPVAESQVTVRGREGLTQLPELSQGRPANNNSSLLQSMVVRSEEVEGMVWKDRKLLVSDVDPEEQK